MSELLFIRHAETDMAGTFCGYSDPPLNERGQCQANGLLASLAPTALDAIYSSDLRRAIETATPIADALRIPHIKTPLLREIDFGKWEGLRWAEIEQLDADYARNWLAQFPTLPALGGEAFPAFEHRVVKQVNELLADANQRRIAVITHAGVMRVVLRAIMGRTEQEAWKLTKPYCSSFVCTDRAGR